MSMPLIEPHGGEHRLRPLLLTGPELKEAQAYASTLTRVPMTSRETSDVLMLGIGAFTPLTGFMGYADWRRVCESYTTADGVFWPIPITLSATSELSASIKIGDEVALADEESGEIVAVMEMAEKYTIDK